MEQILVVGYFGAGNVGDEAILEAIAQEFRRRRPGIRIAATQAGDRWSVGAEIPPVSLFDVDALSTAISESSAVLFGCGGVFQDYWGAYESSLFKERTNGVEAYVRPSLLARLRGVPSVLFSAGIGPLTTPAARQILALGCAGVELASVRDEPSRAAFESAGTGISPVLAADPAYLLDVPERARATVRARLAEAGLSPGSFLLVVIRSWPFARDAGHLAAKIASGLKSLPGDLPLLFVPFHETGSDDDDVSFAGRVRELVGRGDLFRGIGVREALALSAEARLVLAGRNHAAIFAHVSGTPFVALAYDPKVAQVSRAGGVESLTLGLDEIDLLSHRLRLALGTEDAVRQRLRSTIDPIRDRAALPFEMTERALDARREAPVRAVSTGLESVTAALREERAERFRLEELAAALESERADLATRLKESEAERDDLTRERLRHLDEITYFSGRDLALSRELASIHGSRLWKVGMAWWRFLDLLRRLRGRGGPRRAPELAARSAPAAAETLEGSKGEPAEVAAPLYRSGPPPGNRHDVVCFPIIDWDFRFQRPQQLMKRFGAAGHRVFYVAQTFRSEGRAYEVTEKAPNVWEVSLRGPARNVYKDALSDAEAEEILKSLDELRREEGLGATASVVQLPFWWPVAERARARLAWPVVYDCMDFHAGFSTNEEAMLERERALVAGAELVVVSSAFLEREISPSARRVLRVPNACEYGHFAGVAPRRAGGHPVVGYYGAIADWFDADLVADLAGRRPDWTFLLVGSTFSADLRRLSTLPNVQLPGEVAYADLPGWLAKMDVCFIPFRRIPLTEATNPVKAYEILAAGKPLVSVPLPEVVALGKLVRTAEDPAGFEREIEAALAETAGPVVEERRAFACGQTWEKRYEVLEEAVRSSFPKASIVVITYDNLEWNRICLESLYGRTEWPNLEVIVVDNASKDGTPAFLREAATRYPNLELILNTENRGFAGGNNQGLKKATGDVLVLLNNDTSVSRGWLSALIRHLTADPTIGLIGPVTNEIGNEAKIPVGYRDLSGMPRWAEGFVRRNDGAVGPIPMLAMFCVALRRDVLDRTGLLDERFDTGLFEDDDYSRRVQAEGFRIALTRDSFVHHAGGASFKKLGDAKYMEVFERNRARFQEKWGLWRPPVNPETRAKIPAFREELLSRVARSGVDPSRIVVFLPSIGWNIALVQRPQHLAREFVKQGYLAVYDCTGSAADVFGGFREVEENLLLFNGPIAILEALENPLVWAFPYNAALVDQWPRRRVLYDFIDDLDVFPYNKDELARNHEKMVREAEQVFCVSKKLLEQTRLARPDAVYLPNAVEAERFESLTSPEPPLPEFVEFTGRFGKVAGYYGAIASWMDVELVAETARRRPEWGFVLIGFKLADAPSLKPLEALENVLILDAQQYERLPGYLARFTAGFIPFKVNAVTAATSPLKLYEYFSGGKPVISSPMPECAAYPEVTIVRDAAEFSLALDKAAKDAASPAFVARVRTIGRENSWAARVATVRRLIEVGPRQAPAAPSPLPRPEEPKRPAGPRRAATSPPKRPPAPASWKSAFHYQGQHEAGFCNVCGTEGLFTFSAPSSFRESLVCAGCGATSRYRSIARGILRALRDGRGVDVRSLSALADIPKAPLFRVYDTQVAFEADSCAYPIPTLLSRCPWIEVETSTLKPEEPLGKNVGPGVTNQSLESLTFPDATFDLVVTSDVMEHVRLDDKAHREIHRVLAAGGVYVFTVPHRRTAAETVIRRRVVVAGDPSRDEDVLPVQFHGDANSPDDRALVYREFGTDLDEKLRQIGFSVVYAGDDVPEQAIRRTELFYCVKQTARRG